MSRYMLVPTLLLLVVGCKRADTGNTTQTAGQLPQQTFDRSDGTHVSCPMPRPDVVEASHAQAIQADIDMVTRLVRAETTDSTVLQRIRGISRDDYAIRVYALCQTYGTNGLTLAEYNKATNLLGADRPSTDSGR